jgi:hypothetical protein
LEISKESLDTKLEDLSKAEPTILEEGISNLTRDINYYIQSREKECKGEFSSIEINSNGESEVFKRKLSKEEKKLCLLELIYFRKKYVTEIFKLRKKVVLDNHKKQLEELNAIKHESLKALDSLTNKMTVKDGKKK